MALCLTRVVVKTMMLIEIRNNLVHTQKIWNHSTRSYARWSHRHPSKIYVEDSENENTDESSESHGYLKNKNTQPTQQLAKKNLRNKCAYDTIKNSKDIPMTDSTRDETSDKINVTQTDDDVMKGTKYTILNSQDATLSRLMLKVKSHKKREKFDLLVLEGKRLNQDALLAGLIPESFFFSQIAHISSLQIPARHVKLYKVPYKQLQLWSDVTTSPGLMGFYKISSAKKIKPENSLPLTVICDNIREPGNMGAIIRVAAGVGCQKVLLTKGCVDVWDSKVLRAGAGAHFRTPVEQGIEWDYIKQKLDKHSNIFIADSTQEFGNKEDTHNLPLIPYYGVRYTALCPLVVVIGGETEGISQEALLLARYLNGVRINIPLANSVESLNSGSALSVILFEIKRQLTLCNSDVLYMADSK